ncbi:hypothetical protein Hanom_Chr04g00322071 [Helianthus anomalus]
MRMLCAVGAQCNDYDAKEINEGAQKCRIDEDEQKLVTAEFELNAIKKAFADAELLLEVMGN